MTAETWHGTHGGYTNHGCREECCAAIHRAYARVYNRKWRAENRQKPMPVWVQHGTRNAYDNYGCRCPSCRAATAARQRRQYARKREAKP